MAFDVKQAIIDRLRATKRKNIEAVLDYMEKNGFYSCSCLYHHKYTGGLADYVWQTYQIALKLVAERHLSNPNVEKLTEDTIAIISLLAYFCECPGCRTNKTLDTLTDLDFELTKVEYDYLNVKPIEPVFKNRNGDIVKCGRTIFRRIAGDNPDVKALDMLIRESSEYSQEAYVGNDVPITDKNQLQYYLQNISRLDDKNIIFQAKEGWFMNLHSPYTGEIDPDWKDKIIGVKEYSTAELYGINDSMCGAIFILESGEKKGLFVLHHSPGMQGGAYFSPDKDPFIYSEIKIYSNWYEWNDYGYVACKQDNGWKLVKVTQFPMPEYTVVGEGFASAEDAMKSIGVDDCDKYLAAY